MTRPQLLAIEGSIVLAGLILLAVLFGLPAIGSDGGKADDDVVTGPQVTDAPQGLQGGGIVPSQTPRAVAESCAPPTDRDFFSANQIVSFYGNPYTEHMGILGKHEPTELVRLLNEQVDAYDAANGFRGVQGALHIVSTTAQPNPGADGLYVLHVDDETLDEWVDIACEHGLLLFLDIQIGRNTLEAELSRLRPFLSHPHVHLALDPEFAMDEGEVPGEVIGEFDADEINQAQQFLQQLLEDEGLPDKVLVVHQFTDEMIQRREDIAQFHDVRVIVDMDGFGDPATKMKKYKWYGEPAEYGGIKLFLEQDTPVMTPDEVLKLNPTLVIFS